MGTGPYRRKKRNKGDHPMKEKYRTKRKTKDLDEIQADMMPAKAQKLLSQEVNDDLPGSAQHYCITCSKYCVSEVALQTHLRGKPHKKRLKALKTEAYTQKEADRAAGMGSYVAPKTFNIDLPERMDAASQDANDT